MKPRPVDFRGETFSSLKELAERYDVHYGNLVRRVRSGWTMEQALGLAAKPKRVAHNPTRLKSSIGAFDSIRQASQATGIEWRTIQARLSRGWTVDEALGVKQRPPPRKKGRTVECEGGLFDSISALADHYGVNRIRTLSRLDSGWTPEQAVGVESAPPRFRDQSGAARDHAWTSKAILPDGAIVPATRVGFYMLYLICNQRNAKEYVGITTNDLRARLRGHWRMVKIGRQSKLYNAMRRAEKEGHKKDFIIRPIRNDAKDFRELQEQEVAEIQKRNSIKSGYNTAAGGSIGTSSPIQVDGEWFPSRQAAAQFFGIPVSRFNLRLSRLGYSPEEAADLVARDKYGRRKVNVLGQEYASLQAATDHFDVNYKTVHKRLMKGNWSLEQALGLEDPPDTSRFVGISVEVGGVKYKSIEAAAKAHGINPGSVTARMRRKGESCEVAINALKKK